MIVGVCGCVCLFVGVVVCVVGYVVVYGRVALCVWLVCVCVCTFLVCR